MLPVEFLAEQEHREVRPLTIEARTDMQEALLSERRAVITTAGAISPTELIASEDYRLFCEGRLANPYELLAWLRDNDPVHFSPVLDAWIVTRYTDVFEAFLDRRFLYDRVSASMSALPDEMQTSCAPLGDHVSNWLGYTDPPKHTRLRGLLRTTFTPKLAKALTERITEITDDLIDGMVAREQCDLVSDFAFPLRLASSVRSSVFRKGTSAASRRVGRHGGIYRSHRADPGGDRASCYGQLRRPRGVFRSVGCRAHSLPRQRPGATKLAGDEASGKLSRQELIGLSVFSLVAGHETTASLIANGLKNALGR